jgi:hypothetical protein
MAHEQQGNRERLLIDVAPRHSTAAYQAVELVAEAEPSMTPAAL